MEKLAGEIGIDGKRNQSLELKINGYAVTTVYSIIVVLFGMAYKKLARHQTERENYRYQTDFDNALINRLFVFNFLNFYVPMLLVAFYRRSYVQTFIMMLTQMMFKQVSYNLIELLLPILRTRSKLKLIKE